MAKVDRAVFVYNANKPHARAVAQRGAAWCRENHITPRVTSRRQFHCREGDLAVAIGGDGTLLRVASVLYPARVPILGVHMGSLGFLSSCTADCLPEVLTQYMNGDAGLEERTRLAANWEKNEHTALNDVALLGANRGKLAKLDLWCDGEPVAALTGDGLVAATPTGASAYALACGGPVVSPYLRGLLLVPVAPHRLGARPLVLPDSATVTVRTHYPVHIMLDGDTIGELKPGEELTLWAASATTLLVKPTGEPSTFHRLHEKLGWPPGPATKGEQ